MRARPRGGVLCLLLVSLSTVQAAAGEPARISLIEQRLADGSQRVVAAVTDGAGTPVAGTPVTFLARTAFGWLRLGEVDTDATGTASIPGPPVLPYGEVRVVGEDEALSASVLFEEVAARDPVRRPGLDVLRRLSPQPGLVSPYPPIQILFVAGLLAGIWTTYAYLITLLVRMRRAP